MFKKKVKYTLNQIKTKREWRIMQFGGGEKEREKQASK